MKPVLILIALVIIFSAGTAVPQKASPKTDAKSYKIHGHVGCTFTTTGKHPFFVLQPGYRIILTGKAAKDSIVLTITVTDDTKIVKGVETRVVEEQETINGVTSEVSRNYFAICRETGTIFYFGEDVDNYKNGKIASHNGSWQADGKNRAGVFLPGTIYPGDRYYQEVAPGIAMDRAEIIASGEVVELPSGKFNGCLKTIESTDLDSHEKEYKWYAPGIGLIKCENLVLSRYGYIK